MLAWKLVRSRALEGQFRYSFSLSLSLALPWPLFSFLLPCWWWILSAYKLTWTHYRPYTVIIKRRNKVGGLAPSEYLQQGTVG